MYYNLWQPIRRDHSAGPGSIPIGGLRVRSGLGGGLRPGMLSVASGVEARVLHVARIGLDAPAGDMTGTRNTGSRVVVNWWTTLDGLIVGPKGWATAATFRIRYC
jgi:hypothetical protein